MYQGVRSYCATNDVPNPKRSNFKAHSSISSTFRYFDGIQRRQVFGATHINPAFGRTLFQHCPLRTTIGESTAVNQSATSSVLTNYLAVSHGSRFVAHSTESKFVSIYSTSSVRSSLVQIPKQEDDLEPAQLVVRDVETLGQCAFLKTRSNQDVLVTTSKSSGHMNTFVKLWDLRYTKSSVATHLLEGSLMDMTNTRGEDTSRMFFSSFENKIYSIDFDDALFAVANGKVGEASLRDSSSDHHILSLTSSPLVLYSEEKELLLAIQGSGHIWIFQMEDLEKNMSYFKKTVLAPEYFSQGLLQWMVGCPQDCRFGCVSPSDYLPMGFKKVRKVMSSRIWKHNGALYLCLNMTVSYTDNDPSKGLGSGSTSNQSDNQDIIIVLKCESGFQESPLTTSHFAVQRPYCKLSCKDIGFGFNNQLLAVPSYHGIKLYSMQAVEDSEQLPQPFLDPMNLFLGRQPHSLPLIREIPLESKSVLNCKVSPREPIVFFANKNGLIQSLQPKL